MAVTNYRTTAELKEQIVRLALGWADTQDAIGRCTDAHFGCETCMFHSDCEPLHAGKPTAQALHEACAELRQEESTSSAAELDGRKKA